MSNVSRGFAYEREVKRHFVDAGWGCTRAAHSASGMDLIAWVKKYTPCMAAWEVFEKYGYKDKFSRSTTIPLRYMASKIEKKYIKHVYWQVVMDDVWIVVLMQCKIRKR